MKGERQFGSVGQEPRDRYVVGGLDEKIIWDPALYFSRGHLPEEFIGKRVTIFRRPEKEEEKRPKGLSWASSSRLRQAQNRSHLAWTRAEESGAELQTGRFIEEYLTAYLGKKVRLWEVKVQERGENYPDRRYGFEILDGPSRRVRLV